MATLLDFIGNTPLIELNNINPKPDKVKLYGKLEGNNPGGSVKDRAAYNMISEAVKRGDIKPGMKLIEATSGNTGIALAMNEYSISSPACSVPETVPSDSNQTNASCGPEKKRISSTKISPSRSVYARKRALPTS